MDVGPGSRQQTVGVVGLGDLGTTIARALSGHRPVIAYDAAPAARDRAVTAGLEVLDDPTVLARSCNTVVLALPSAIEMADAVARLAPYAPGLLLLGTARLAPDDVRRIAAAALTDGSTYLDVPVTGHPDDVGRWRLAYGGPAAAYDAVVALLGPVASEVVRAGEVGSASERV